MFYLYWPLALKNYLVILITVIIGLSPTLSLANTGEHLLTLKEAEEIALESDSLTLSFNASAEALNQQSIADSQFSDPKLKIGAMNFPVDTFNRGQEPMTQLQIGVQQMFPRGRTLEYKGSHTEALSDVESARAQDRQLSVKRSVRNAYLDLYFQIQSTHILTEHERLFVQLLDITQKHYAVGRDNQHDVLRAQLELSLLQDKLVELGGMKQAAVAELAKWISYEKASQALPDEQPMLPKIPSLIVITKSLFQHPLILAQDNMIEAIRQQVEIAKEQYKPGWMLDVTYGGRTGNNFDGSNRADFFSAIVLVDIPLFTGKRQDKRVAASKKRHIAAKFTRTDRLRELRRMTERKYARWEQLRERYELYETRTLIEAAQNTEATLKAYQSDVTDFTTLMRARLTELSTELAMVRLRVEQAKVQADLLYYAGDR